VRSSRCFVLEVPGQIGGEEHEAGAWRTGVCMGVALQYDGFVYGFTLRICGQPSLSCVVVGVHWYLCWVNLCLMFSVAQIKAKFILSAKLKRAASILESRV